MINSTPGNPIVPGMMIGGKYRMIRPVGEGAMGAVWAARNEATSAEVAIKLLRQPDPELRQRLQREARAGAALKHRHILDVYDAGETAAGEPFLIMQLLQGETLAALLGRRRRLDPPEAARIGRDVARALAAAHALRLVHRDLKPANIFLHQEPGEDEPLVKVLDFGVAKDLSSSDSLRTVVGTVIGSLFYMSPEQASAEPEVDHRSDLWSLGVVLFEMLTGQRPFQGDSKHVLASILQGEIPRVSRYVRRVNGELDDLVARCMCRNREERHGSAAEVAKLLHRLAEAPPDAAAGRASMPSVPDAMVALGAGAPGVAAEAARASTPELARASAPGLTDARAPEITKTLVLPEPEPAARHPRGGAARPPRRPPPRRHRTPRHLARRLFPPTSWLSKRSLRSLHRHPTLGHHPSSHPPSPPPSRLSRSQHRRTPAQA